MRYTLHILIAFITQNSTAQEFIVSKKKVEPIEKVKELYYKDQKMVQDYGCS
jgi:hypothetical protein